MTEQQAQWITDAAKNEFRIILSESEIPQSMAVLNETIALITSDYYAHELPMGLALIPNRLPVFDKRFPEVLRVLANVWEAKLELDAKDEQKENRINNDS